MSTECSIDPAQQVVTLRLNDDAELADWRNAFEAAIARVAYRPGFHFLLDWRHLVTVPSTAFVEGVVRTVDNRRAELGLCRWAILASADASFGMARMADMLADNRYTDAAAFVDEALAVEWLSGKCRASGTYTRDRLLRDVLPSLAAPPVASLRVI